MIKRKTLIIADDDPDDTEMYKVVMEELEFDVDIEIAKDGLALFQLLENKPAPALIMLDLNMPFLSGKECLVQLRATELYSDVPVIVLSTSNEDKIKQECLEKGASNYYVKPYTYPALLSLFTRIYKEQLTAFLN
ncbi:MAG: response regulator [Bacteroidota bacterium]